MPTAGRFATSETTMTQALHNLIDRSAEQSVINERIAGLFESHNHDIARLTALIDTITSDHEKRIRYIERAVSLAFGATGVIGVGVTIAVALVKAFK